MAIEARAIQAGVQTTMVLCVVLGCSKRSGRDRDVSFFRIPKVIHNKGKEVQLLSKRRRDGFLAAVSRVGLTEKILNNDRICSRHFVLGKPADLLDDTSPDWLPSLNLGHSKSRHSTNATGRWERRKARQIQADSQEAAQTLMLLSMSESSQTTSNSVNELETVCFLPSDPTETSADDHFEATNLSADASQTSAKADIATQTSADLKVDESTQTQESEDLQCTVRCPTTRIDRPFTEDTFQKDEFVKFYTGLPNFKVLKSVYNYVISALPTASNSKLEQFQEYVAVLMKLRLNCQIQDLAYRFSVSVSTISRIFLKWLSTMDRRLSLLVLWPDRDALMKTMPVCFQSSFGKKVAVILDCFEVFLERPSNLHARACTWSQYKHHNTVKILLGITPQGVICYVSETWGGRVSDKYITEHCGILDKLTPGDVVLADRGFDISDSVGTMQAQLHIPAFTKGKNQLSALEVHETRTIANVRIHVERVIGNVRQKYSILQSTLPIQYVMKREGNCPTIDKIVRVCCALCNVCESVIPFD